jgi:hypothetical protein
MHLDVYGLSISFFHLLFPTCLSLDDVAVHAGL